MLMPTRRKIESPKYEIIIQSSRESPRLGRDLRGVPPNLTIIETSKSGLGRMVFITTL